MLFRSDRHRGNDEGDAPLLLDGNSAAGECDVVIGGKEGDQTEGHSADGLGGTEPVKPEGADTEGAGVWLGGGIFFFILPQCPCLKF